MLIMENKEKQETIFITIFNPTKRVEGGYLLYMYECYIHSTIFQVNHFYNIVRSPQQI